MGEAYIRRLWNSFIRFCVCLSVLWISVQSEDNVAYKRCRTSKSDVTYMGSRNVTKSGKTCQAWVAGHPHSVAPNIKDENFSDGSKRDAKNFCRNPSPSDHSGMFCYTTDPAVKTEHCNSCPGNSEEYYGCKLSDKGAHYSGTLDHSQSHAECDSWSSHENSQFMFPDGSAEKAKNYCRNPDPKIYEAPWCFIKNMPGVPWEYCDICKPFDGEVAPWLGKYNEGIVEAPSMGRIECIRWCITWLSCMAVVIPHDDRGKKCWYLTKLNGPTVTDAGRDQYTVKRVCPANAKGGARFVEVGQMGSANGVDLGVGTVGVCDEACSANPDCVFYDRDSADGKCMSNSDVNVHSHAAETGIERLVMRCDPSLGRNPMMFYALIAGCALIAVVVMGCCCFVCYKLIHKRRKAASKQKAAKDEKKLLTPKKP